MTELEKWQALIEIIAVGSFWLFIIAAVVVNGLFFKKMYDFYISKNKKPRN